MPQAKSAVALAWGGIAGPVAFVAGWAALGASRPGYSPISDAISRLAERGATTRPAMTVTFVAYAAGLLALAAALRRRAPGPVWALAAGTGIATLAVAALPLGSPTTGALHAVAAVVGYGTLSGFVLVTARSGLHRPTERFVGALGWLTLALLTVSVVVTPAHGLTQRAGLTVGDAVVVWVAWQLRTDRASSPT